MSDYKEVRTREEHLQWCKDRAIEYIKRNDLTNAWSSMCSDVNKHSGTRNHPAIELGMMLMMNGDLQTPQKLKKFIEGFN